MALTTRISPAPDLTLFRDEDASPDAMQTGIGRPVHPRGGPYHVRIIWARLTTIWMPSGLLGILALGLSVLSVHTQPSHRLTAFPLHVLMGLLS